MIINCTPHDVVIASEENFTNLEQLNPTTWVADGIQGEARIIKSSGNVRISVVTVESGSVENIPLVESKYGDISGIPDNANPATDILIVSLPVVSMIKAKGGEWSNSVVSPYKVVRNRANTSEVLGCMGLTK
jgi:hypothetical protein